MVTPKTNRTKTSSSARRAAQEAARNAVRAARAARRGTFENVITMANVPAQYGVTLDKQMYDPRALARWLNTNPRNPAVPTSRRRLNAQEVAMVRRMAQIANGAEGYVPLHAMMHRARPPPAPPAAEFSENQIRGMSAQLARAFGQQRFSRSQVLQVMRRAARTARVPASRNNAVEILRYAHSLRRAA